MHSFRRSGTQHTHLDVTDNLSCIMQPPYRKVHVSPQHALNPVRPETCKDTGLCNVKIWDSERPEPLVMQVSLQSATPCVHVFPATMALAKNFVGFAAFGRLIGDASEETRQLLRELDIKEVSTDR